MSSIRMPTRTKKNKALNYIIQKKIRFVGNSASVTWLLDERVMGRCDWSCWGGEGGGIIGSCWWVGGW